MGYINSLRSFGQQSSNRSRVKKRVSADQWRSALTAADSAHWFLRGTAEAAENGKLEDAETMASCGVEQLKLSVSQIPRQPLYERKLESLWDGSKLLEEALSNLLNQYPHLVS